MKIQYRLGFINFIYDCYFLKMIIHYLDNNNCSPSFLTSFCEFGGDCFGPRYFSEGAQEKNTITKVQNNHRRIHTMTEK